MLIDNEVEKLFAGPSFIISRSRLLKACDGLVVILKELIKEWMRWATERRGSAGQVMLLAGNAGRGEQQINNWKMQQLCKNIEKE